MAKYPPPDPNLSLFMQPAIMHRRQERVQEESEWWMGDILHLGPHKEREGEGAILSHGPAQPEKVDRAPLKGSGQVW